MNHEELLAQLGANITPELLQQALTHSSFAYEQGGQNNERLEFLGDAILGYVVTAHLYKSLPDLNEGELTKLKNAVVSAQALASVSQRLDLGKQLLLGKGEEQTQGRKKLNLLADAFEAILGAAYLSGGLIEAEKLIEKFIFPLLSDPDAIREAADPKTTLNEKLLSLGMEPVVYENSYEGPDHDRTFHAIAFSGTEELGRGSGTTRKSSETEAAIEALRYLANA